LMRSSNPSLPVRWPGIEPASLAAVAQGRLSTPIPNTPHLM
jgi:hypothetical protein